MKSILINVPKGRHKDKFLEIISKTTKINKKSLEVLEKYYKEDLWFFFSVLEKQTVNFSSVEELNEVKLMIEINEFIDTNKSSFEDKIKVLSKDNKLSTNKIFQLYNKYQQFFKGDK